MEMLSYFQTLSTLIFLYEASNFLLEVQGSILRFKKPKGDVQNELDASENYLQLCVKWAQLFLRLLIWRKIEMSINNAHYWFLRSALGNVHKMSELKIYLKLSKD